MAQLPVQTRSIDVLWPKTCPVSRVSTDVYMSLNRPWTQVLMQTGQRWRCFHFEELWQWYLQSGHLFRLEQEHLSVYFDLNQLIHRSFVLALGLREIDE